MQQTQAQVDEVTNIMKMNVDKGKLMKNTKYFLLKNNY